ncbi:MAG: hypothetical protein F6K42_07005, partial [Leptolyngbya sp. SIO1D8]|nr:hypothetical protein [Leptolyngbya sp. SIO1D8]
MASSPQRRRRRQNRSQFWQNFFRKHSVEPTGIPVGWLCLTAILYAAAGTIMASFPAPYWIWNLALGGVIVQSLALAGPKALRRFGWWAANGLALLAIVGTGALVIALATALGYAGTDNLDEIIPKETAFEVIRMGFVAVILAASGGIIGAETGDRLLRILNRLQTTLVLAATCILGLGL